MPTTCPDPLEVQECADLIEEAHGTSRRFRLAWRPGDGLDERCRLLDLHGAVVAELRRRGRIPRATVEHPEAGIEHFVIWLAL